MSVNLITEKAVADIKSTAHLLITQPETVGGVSVESLRRATLADAVEAITTNGVYANLAATAETSTTAAYAHSSGDYFLLNGALYIATAAISVGGTITSGTNCQAAPITGEVADLKSAIDDLGDAVEDLEDAAENSPTIEDSSAEGVDLDVSDPDGNVILRLKDGHIQTKNFSSKHQTVLSSGSDAVADLDLSDTNGNVLVRFANGQIYTQNFNSGYIRQLTGKLWAVVGDSLTEINSRTTLHYYDYIAQETGITVYNMGSSGTGYMRHQEDNKAFYQRIVNVPVDSDAVTIFGSFNDLGGGYDLGTATDSGTTTIGGCINATIDALYNVIPAVHLGIVTPTPWDNIRPGNPEGNGEKYVGLIKDICNRRSIPCLDLFHCSNLRPWESDFLGVAYTKDEGNGVHPDETGHALIAPMFRQFLFSII